MILPLLLSSFAAGLIATVLMVFTLYLPRLWRGGTYDMVGAIGAALVGRESSQSRFMGWTVYFLVGTVFAVAYGAAVMALMSWNSSPLPDRPVGALIPTELDVSYLLLGGLLGLIHGAFVAWWLAGYLAPSHPVEQYRYGRGLVPTQLLSHAVFGGAVTFLQHQFLQLLSMAA